jgi:hypothetical protein
MGSIYAFSIPFTREKAGEVALPGQNQGVTRDFQAEKA